jgi:hypothetical protein
VIQPHLPLLFSQGEKETESIFVQAFLRRVDVCESVTYPVSCLSHAQKESSAVPIFSSSLSVCLFRFFRSSPPASLALFRLPTRVNLLSGLVHPNSNTQRALSAAISLPQQMPTFTEDEHPEIVSLRRAKQTLIDQLESERNEAALVKQELAETKLEVRELRGAVRPFPFLSTAPGLTII